MSRKKTKIAILLVVVVGILTIIVIKNLFFSGPMYEYPASGLSPSQNTHSYKAFNGLVERANVENIVIDVPESSIQTSTAAYLYDLGNNSILCVTEVQSLLEPKDVALNVLQCFDTTQKRINVISTDTGFMNGYKWTYICAETKEYAVTLYKTHAAGIYDLVIATLSKNPTNEIIRQGVVIQQGVIGTISEVGEDSSSQNTDSSKSDDKKVMHENPYLDKYDDFQSLYDLERSVWRDIKYTQQYNKYVVAERNYEHMRLTVNWTDVHVTPRQLILLDRNEDLEYSPVEMEEGKYVFIVDDVGYGDEFVLYFDMQNPGSIVIQQEEELDYEEYYNRPDDDYADFVLHDDDGEPLTEEESKTETETQTETTVDGDTEAAEGVTKD